MNLPLVNACLRLVFVATLTILSAVSFIGCHLVLDDLDRVNYAMSKEDILVCLGSPEEQYILPISDQEILAHVTANADPTTGTLRNAKIGDVLTRYRYRRGNKTLRVEFLNDDTHPANLYTTENQ